MVCVVRGFARARGLLTLVADAVEHGSRGIEQVHLEIGGRPFDLAAAIPGLTVPAEAAHVVYDVSVSATYAAVRLGNRAARVVIGTAIDVAQQRESSKKL